jgi:hypothetical protein
MKTATSHTSATLLPQTVYAWQLRRKALIRAAKPSSNRGFATAGIMYAGYTQIDNYRREYDHY